MARPRPRSRRHTGAWLAIGCVFGRLLLSAGIWAGSYTWMENRAARFPRSW